MRFREGRWVGVQGSIESSGGRVRCWIACGRESEVREGADLGGWEVLVGNGDGAGLEGKMAEMGLK